MVEQLLEKSIEELQKEAEEMASRVTNKAYDNDIFKQEESNN